MLTTAVKSTPVAGEPRSQLLAGAARALAHAIEVGATRTVFIIRKFMTNETQYACTPVTQLYLHFLVRRARSKDTQRSRAASYWAGTRAWHIALRRASIALIGKAECTSRRAVSL